MRANVERMKYEVKNAETTTSKLRYEQSNEYPKQHNNLFSNNVSNNTLERNVIGSKSQNRLYMQSTLNTIQPKGNVNNYTNYND